MLGRYFPISVGICADAATATKQIYNEIKKQKITLETSIWTKKYLKERNNFLIKREKDGSINKFPIQPEGLFKQLRNVLPKNSAITLDAGTLCLQATDALKYFNPTFIIYTFRFWISWIFFCMWIGC